VNEIRQTIKSFGYADANEASATHKEICKSLASRLTKVGENAHLAIDFLRGPRSGELERLMRSLKDDVEIFRDEVLSSYIDWRYPRSQVIREIIDRDVQLVRLSSNLVQLTEHLRESSLSKNTNVMQQRSTEIIEIISKMAYLFSDRDRLLK
jgi:hypothetical protein